MGLRICAVDIDEDKLTLARTLGADFTVNASQGDRAIAWSIQAGRRHDAQRGTCVLVGLPPGDFPVPLFEVVANCITIRGSFVGNREDMAKALAFAAAGKVKADIELQPLTAINEVFERWSMARRQLGSSSTSRALERTS